MIQLSSKMQAQRYCKHSTLMHTQKDFDNQKEKTLGGFNLGERLTNFFTNYKVCKGVDWGFCSVDNDKFCAGFFCQSRKPCCWLNDKGRAYCNKKIACLWPQSCFVHIRCYERLPEGNRCGLEKTATYIAFRGKISWGNTSASFIHRGLVVTIKAGNVTHRSMEFNDPIVR